MTLITPAQKQIMINDIHFIIFRDIEVKGGIYIKQLFYLKKGMLKCIGL